MLGLSVAYPAVVAVIVMTLPASDRADFDAETLLTIVRGACAALGGAVTALVRNPIVAAPGITGPLPHG